MTKRQIDSIVHPLDLDDQEEDIDNFDDFDDDFDEDFDDELDEDFDEEIEKEYDDDWKPAKA